ncbi:hypothetical protein HYX13_04220 [Candidatus Woesearchaeota archaeon]|nr:hypothetical protein [Candidatus Woesearchaeota archaeon]
MNREKLRRLKEEFKKEYTILLDREGFYFSIGIGLRDDVMNKVLELRLTPKEGTLEDLTDELKSRIDEIVPKVYQGAEVYYQYMGLPTHRNK